ncbi:Myb DNA-bind 3 domain-containing protein [Abeliophyllum distichum]|uniref:Myb DNA-bind 3 domain-containing protein n=1 Tax=Abeliophyllum distichum TaxID=126358 RepID=A0ABD1UK16_9LAMI
MTKFMKEDPSDEVWEEYFKSHPGDRSYCIDTFVDYEDLRIAVGSATAVGTHVTALGDDTDARTFETEERRDFGGLIDDFTYDLDSESFIQTDKQDHLYQSPSLEQSTQPLPPKSTSSGVLPTNRKRNRTEI